MSEAATLTTEAIPAPTPLAAQLRLERPQMALKTHAGAVTPEAFSPLQDELAAAITAGAVFDLAYRTRLRITGADRLRWMNGMVSNAIQALPEGHGNYNFILNAQGRIQGDAYIYRAPNSLILDTDRSQAAHLLAHLDHFIIMDDVELHPLDDAASGNATSSIGVTGPLATAILEKLGLVPSSLAPMQFVETALDGAPLTLVRAYSIRVPRYELWCNAGNANAVWKSLIGAGAQPIGIDAVEALRVLDGIPRYGIDITDRHLPQETSQTRALNFTKGCYLGQEIVERIRSRATVHRNLRQFSLAGSTPAAPIELHAESDPAAIGQLTSIAEFRLPDLTHTLAIGSIRTEAVERKLPLEYNGGIATVLDRPPALP